MAKNSELKALPSRVLCPDGTETDLRELTDEERERLCSQLTIAICSR